MFEKKEKNNQGIEPGGSAFHRKQHSTSCNICPLSIGLSILCLTVWWARHMSQPYVAYVCILVTELSQDVFGQVHPPTTLSGSWDPFVSWKISIILPARHQHITCIHFQSPILCMLDNVQSPFFSSPWWFCYISSVSVQHCSYPSVAFTSLPPTAESVWKGRTGWPVPIGLGSRACICPIFRKANARSAARAAHSSGSWQPEIGIQREFLLAAMDAVETENHQRPKCGGSGPSHLFLAALLHGFPRLQVCHMSIFGISCHFLNRVEDFTRFKLYPTCTYCTVL